MPGPQSSNGYTCTCTHFCGGYKTGLSRATYYRHSSYRDLDAAQPSSFSTAFQSFLDESTSNSGSGRSGIGQEEPQGNTDDLEAEFTTSPHASVLDGSTQNFEETAGVNFFFSNL